MSRSSTAPIEIWYNAEGVPYSLTTGRLSAIPPKSIVDYAHEKGVSWDGCWTLADIEYRSGMLKGIVKAHENGWLKR